MGLNRLLWDFLDYSYHGERGNRRWGFGTRDWALGIGRLSGWTPARGSPLNLNSTAPEISHPRPPSEGTKCWESRQACGHWPVTSPDSLRWALKETSGGT